MGKIKFLTPADRLIVAADFKPDPIMGQARAHVESQVLTLAESLQGTNVYIKVNAALRACGYGLIDRIHDYGLRVFADLKLYDIGETLGTDGTLLREAKPELLTVVCTTGFAAMQVLKAALPGTEVLGVTVLTSLKEVDTRKMFACSVEEAVLRFAKEGHLAGIDGFISSAHEVKMLREYFGNAVSLNTPAIRPLWAVVEGDDQNPDRIMTPAKAIQAGADRIVIGRPITQAKDPFDAVMRTLEEIASVPMACS